MRRIVPRQSVRYSFEVLCWTLGIVLLLAWLAARVTGEMERRAAIANFAGAVTSVPDPAAPAVQPAVLRSRLQVQHEPNQTFWSKSRVRAFAAAMSDAKAAVHPATVEAILRIPRVGLDVPVYAKVNEWNLNRGAGLIANTAKPGSDGNVAIAAHRDGYFRVLKNVAVGDALELQTPTGPREYKIAWMSIVKPDDVQPLAPTAVPSVTLVTCYPFYFVGPAPQRYIVRAVAAASTL